ncbi:MAG: hypothetical protein FJ399_10230 [Verrucomicrobia bacterium]|nr:hypothetical protein [Verrucomicrobiota bacterium]
MHQYLIPGIIVTSVMIAGGASRGAQLAGVGGLPGFRVRSDFTAGLNANRGWAGALNENPSVNADQPFRLRFEVEGASAATSGRRFQLQYRRNQEPWANVEAHDFPHPKRDLTLRFVSAASGAAPEGWRAAQGNADGMRIAAAGQVKVLRAETGRQPLVGLYAPPWEPTELAVAFRLPSGNRTGVGFVFSHIDSGNHGSVFLDPAAGTIRVSRRVHGTESVITERKAAIAVGEWLQIEVQTENGKVRVNFQNGTVDFTADYRVAAPSDSVGFQVPAASAVEFRQFGIAGVPQTPRVSIVACPAYANGAATTDLLQGSTAGFRAGAGVQLAERTPPWSGGGVHGEFEWALVVRRFADGAVINEEGDTFEFRMTDAGAPVASRHPVLRLAIPAGHVGGTFIENPGRIGPWQAANGDLYFMMEPAETHNVFMMIKSTDGGRSWREVDGANRPRTGDLESVDARQVGHTIHILHQVTRSARYHSFRTSDHPTQPDTWAVRDEIAGQVRAIAQMATMVARSDGSLVAFYLGQAKVHSSVRSPSGMWGQVQTLDPDMGPNQGGPQAVVGANDVIHLAYYGTDGTIWYRRFMRDGSLTPRQQLATGAGTSRAEYGAVLPLVYIPKSNTVVIIYRLDNGSLWERRVVDHGPPTPAVRMTDRLVVTDAVDSQQAGADAVLDGETVHVLFIEKSSRSIFSTNDRGGWQPAKLLVGGIKGSWVRGNVYRGKDGATVYGYVYDAGSDGGAGLNRYAELGLHEAAVRR